ncbi:hypothetical protein ACVWXU_006723 [Streptomyces sp. TE33382]
MGAEVRGGRALLRTDDSDATVVELARIGAVRGLSVSRATLEDAFLALTSPAGSRLPGTSRPADASEETV